jgi:hypothetical protein
LLLAASMLALLAYGCSSNDFGPTGSDLPADVSQDSLAVPLDIVGTQQEERLDLPLPVPPEGNPINRRQFLYFGTRSDLGIQATPFLQYPIVGVSSGTADSLVADPALIQEAILSVRVTRFDRNQTLHLAVYELSSPLDSTMVNDPVTDHLGEELGEYEVSAGDGGTRYVYLLRNLDAAAALALKEKIAGWIKDGAFNGLALVNLDDSPLMLLTSPYFNFNAYEYELWFRRETGVPIIYPRFTVNYDLGGTGSLGLIFKAANSLTVFERTAPVPTATLLGGYLPRRMWLNFDLSGIPRAATINSAQLVLHFDTSKMIMGGLPGDEIPFTSAEDDTNLIARSIGDRTFENSTLTPVDFTVVAYEATQAQAQSLEISGLTQVLDGLTMVRPDVVMSGTEPGDRELRINIADYAQRLVNGIFGDTPPGLLVKISNDELHYMEIPFFDSTASDSLRPRIEIRFTPPADFGN